LGGSLFGWSNTLPKLDDLIRIEMMYAPPRLKPDFQRQYVEIAKAFSIFTNLPDERTPVSFHFPSSIHPPSRSLELLAA
jgi:hypothetical protein